MNPPDWKAQINTLLAEISKYDKAKAVATPEGERIAVKRGGSWMWWKSKDRIAPSSNVTGQAEQAKAESEPQQGKDEERHSR